MVYVRNVKINFLVIKLYEKNAVIIDFKLGFTEQVGTVGKNFILTIVIKDVNNWFSKINFNPSKIPLILNELEVDDLVDIKDKYVILIKHSDYENNILGIKNILSSENKYIATDNNVYFGSNIISNNEGIADYLSNLLEGADNKRKEVLINGIRKCKEALLNGVDYESANSNI